jgi:hypothetical protein
MVDQRLDWLIRQHACQSRDKPSNASILYDATYYGYYKTE